MGMLDETLVFVGLLCLGEVNGGVGELIKCVLEQR